MKQLSRRRRTIYLIILIAIFVVSIPALILYAMGYRLGDALSLVETGGIYVSSTVGDVQVYVDGRLAKNTNIFTHDAFISSLRPGSYTVEVEKTGYQDWIKTVRVYPNKVSTLYAFLPPTAYPIAIVPPSLASTTMTYAQAKAHKLALNPEYVSALALFTATSTPIATSSLPVPEASSSEFLAKQDLHVERGLLLWIDGGHLVADWEKGEDTSPYFFCENDTCTDKIVLSLAKPILDFDFYPGRNDVVIVATEDGIYAMELDARSVSNVYTIMAGSGLSFEVASQSLVYIKDAEGDIYAVSIE